MQNDYLIPVRDEHGNIKNDANKKVIINSISGALVNQKGIVINGPYSFKQIYKRKTNNPGIKKDYQVITQPYWYVLLENNLKVHFVEKELKFL